MDFKHIIQKSKPRLLKLLLTFLLSIAAVIILYQPITAYARDGRISKSTCT